MPGETTSAEAELTLGVAAGVPGINFAAHQVRAGTHGAREDFEIMISQLVRVVRPGARMVAPNPGDWGIDVLVGDLGGVVAIWQSKYFFPIVDKSHQQQIRESFDSACKNASSKGYNLRQWILCIPSSMDGPTSKWWDGWKKRKEREKKIAIEFWDETELRGLLISPDANSVRQHFYEPAKQAALPVAEPAVVLVPADESAILESALFVRQLREAGHVEVMAAKQQFFNAELMAREIVDKGVPSEVAALSSADAVVHGLWEDRFNDACQEHDRRRLPGLHAGVMADIRELHPKFGAGLPGSLVHSCGLMHRVVDGRRAGWVRHWRQIADSEIPVAVEDAGASSSPLIDDETSIQSESNDETIGVPSVPSQESRSSFRGDGFIVDGDAR